VDTTDVTTDSNHADKAAAAVGGKRGLVVLIIIGSVIAAFIVLWILNARETSRRVACSNNLRQIGIACHNYHDTIGTFPTESGSNQSIYSQIVAFAEQPPEKNQSTTTINKHQFICPSRRDPKKAAGKRDYGYAATSGTGSAGKSIFDTPGGMDLTPITISGGPSKTLMLSHVWMNPSNYSGGDPTDIGWATLNNSRSISNAAKQDSDRSGSTSHIGGPHSDALPSLFTDCHVQGIPYTFPYWAELWAWDNTRLFKLPERDP
jgi:hypothetical protein